MKRKFSRILGVGLTIAMLTSLVMVATPVSALSAVSVTPTSTTISATTSYSILFTLGASMNETQKIVVAFPTGTDLTNVGAADISFAATAGIGSAAYSGGSAATIVKSLVSLGAENTVGPTLTISGLTINVSGNVTGVGAMVQLVIADVTNPATAGTTYTLTVGTLTSADVVREAAVTSAAYEIKAPTVTAPPGIASVYNSAGVLMVQGTGTTAIATAIAATAASTAAAGYTIKLSPGTYSESPNTLAPGVTFVATGTAAETIIKGTFTIDVDKTTLDSLTITGGIIGTGATTATIKNSIFKPGTTAPATLLAIDGASNLVSTNTSFAVTGTIATSGITIASGANVTVTDGTFTVDTLGTAIVATGKLTLTNGTFTGSSGTGTGLEMSGAGTVTVTGATFDTLLTALKTTGSSGNLTASKNTIKNSAGDAISLAGNVNKVTITGNDITGTAATKYAVNLAAEVVAATNAFVVFNNITGNTLNIKNADATGDKLNATHNWWGAAAAPATTSISGDVNTANYLTAAATAGTGAVSTASAALVGKTTAGVDVTVTGATPAIIAASKYTDNPVSVAPPYSALTGGYFDVYVGTPGAATAVEIKLYGTVTADTKAYAWNTLQGTWVLAPSQGANTFTGFVYTTLTTATAPAIADLSGLPFVLVSGPAAAPATIALTVPAAGATDKAITNLPFTWAGVTGATSYTLVISAKADLSSPVVTANTTGTAYTYTGTLEYNTPYYWQVTALKDTTVSGKSDIATFVTVAKPVAAAPPVVAPVVVAPISLISPSLGAVDVSLNPILTWTAFTGAIGYEVVLATDPTFAIIDYSHNVPKANTFYASEPLAYATTYYWRVRGITGPAPAKKAAPGGAWATGVFTTIAKPVPPAKVEPTVIVQKEPAPPAEVKIVEVPVQTVVPQPIPSYLLWIIIVIGAVLLIALIVLIARTRRVA